MTDTEIPARPASYDRKVALVLQGGGALGSYQAGVYEALSASPYQPDWVAGMCMLFPRQAFAEVDGFDTRYHLYYEDVDICSRLWLSGYTVMVDPRFSIIHAAQRSSHRNLRYARWHLQSMLRFFRSDVYRKARALHGRR